MQRQKPTVAILYGAGEGRLMGKKLRNALEQAGFAMITDAKDADVLIAHSGGICYIPGAARAKAALIVGPIVGHQGSMFVTQLRKILLDFKGSHQRGQLGAWVGKSALNAGYLLLQPYRVVHMYRHARRRRYELPAIPARQVAVIAFRGDPWSGYLSECGLHATQPYSFMHYDRLHDDIWINPKDYVAVIQYLYAT